MEFVYSRPHRLQFIYCDTLLTLVLLVGLDS